MREEKIRLH